MNYKEKDFVVCGGGYAGICAAIAAARHGLSVALINDRPVLGGNASSEIGVAPGGACANGNSTTIYASEGGIADEIKLEFAKNRADTHAMRDMVLLDMVYREKNIELFLNTLLTCVKKDGDKISEIECIQLLSEKRIQFSAQIFADCTGDGVMAALSGAEFMYGREAKTDFDEELAPEKADDKVMGGTILFDVENTGKPQEFIKPDFACDFEKEPFMKNINASGKFRDIVGTGAQWWLECGGERNTISDNEDITLNLRKIVLGYWDYMKNSGKYPETENLRIKRISQLIGKRESRRILGDYVLSQNDVEKKTVPQSDGVVTGGWKLDLHAPEGIYSDEPATSWKFIDGVYMIPYRCLYSKNIHNMLMAGRNISVTHVALGSTRLINTCAAMGQAIGTAAYLCKKHNENPRGIYKNHIEELKRRLKADNQSMMDYVADNADILNSVEASSVAEYENKCNIKTTALTDNICVAIPVITDKLDALSVGVKNNGSTAEMLNVCVLNGKKIETYRPDNFIREITVDLKPGFDGWVRLDTDASPGDGRKLYVVFEKNENLEIYTSDKTITGAEAFIYYKYGEREHHDLIPLEENTGFYRYERAEFSVCFCDMSPVQELFSEKHILNGFDRPYGVPNCWRSEGTEDEYVRIKLKHPIPIHEISAVFSSPLDAEAIKELPKTLIKDYDICLLNGGENVKFIEVRNNYRRFMKHEITETLADEIIFTPICTYGADYFEIYQILINGGMKGETK